MHELLFSHLLICEHGKWDTTPSHRSNSPGPRAAVFLTCAYPLKHSVNQIHYHTIIQVTNLSLDPTSFLPAS